MVGILFIALVIYVILYYDLLSKYKKLKISNGKLKRKIKKLNEQFGIVDVKKEIHGQVNFNNLDVVNENKEEGSVIQKIEVENIVNENKSMVKKDTKINWLFGIGISLVCLTYFVLLNTTWGMISDITKCILVVLFSLVFFLSSNILDKLIKAPKATMVFWSLGLIYVPFSLIAIFGFGLLGDFLSFSGQGANLCLATIALISFALNLLSSVKFKNAFFVWLYVLSEFLTILLGIRIFSIDNSILFLVMSVYTCVVVLISNYLKQKTDLQYIFTVYDIYKKIILVAFNILTISNIVGLLFNKVNIYTTLAGIIIVLIDIFIACKEKETVYFNLAIYTLLVNVLCLFNLITILHTFNIYLLVIAVYTTIMNLISMYIKNSENTNLCIFEKSINIFSYISVVFCSLSMFGNNVISLITLLVVILNTIRNVYISKNSIFSYLLVFQIMFSVVTLFECIIPDIPYGYITLAILSIIYVLTVLNYDNDKLKYFRSGFIILIPILTFIEFLSNYNIFASVRDLQFYIDKFVYIIATLLMYILAYIKISNKIYTTVVKYFISTLTYILLIVIFNTLTSLNLVLVLTISSSIMTGLFIIFRYIYKPLETPFNIFSNISILVGIFATMIFGKNYMLWYYIVVFLVYLYNSVIQKQNSSDLSNVFKLGYLLVSNLIIYTILNIFETRFDINYLTNYSIFISILIISISLFINNKKMSKLLTWYLGIFNVISAISLIAIPNNNLFISLLPSVSYITLLFMQIQYLDKPLTDVYKAVIYVLLLLPYNILINHFDINLVVLNCTIYISILYLITRTILINYIKNKKSIEVIELISLILIYIIGLVSSIVTFNQAILFDLLLAIIIVYSFIKQENYMFKCTSVSFILIVFIQTKLVDFPVIWLICLLLFGIGFISFATVNEIKKKKEINKE